MSMSDNRTAPCAHISSSIRIAPNGDVKPCCSYLNKVEKLENITDLTSFWTSHPVLVDIKKRNADGQWDLSCQSCFDREKQGLTTRKQRFRRLLDDTQDDSLDDGRLRYLDITFGNTCNLACVMCNSLYSSNWRKHELDFIANNHINDRINDFLYPQEPYAMTYQQIDMICDAMEDVTAVEILGGEPLYDKRFTYWLNEIETRGKLKNLRLQIITNFTVMNDTIAASLMKAKKLKLNISIDGTGRHYDWIRGFDFKHVEENLIKYIPMLGLKDLVLNHVVSCYNVDNLIDYYAWVFKMMDTLNIPIRPLHLICYTPHVQLALSQHREKFMKEDLPLLYQMVQDQTGYDMPTKRLITNDLSNIKNYFTNVPVIDSKDVLDMHRRWHNHLVKMRGWDINDPTTHVVFT